MKTVLLLAALGFIACGDGKTKNQRITEDTKFCRDNGMGVDVIRSDGWIVSVTCNPERKP